jgi:Ca-activated chloride channel family protein
MRRTARRADLFTISILLLVTAPGSGQQPAAPPRQLDRPAPAIQEPAADEVQLSANLVTLTATVRDASGRLVTDLSPADFAIYEDGSAREVDRLYRQGEVPLRLVLLFDTSVSVKDRIDFEKRAASRFFARALRPGDRAALFSFSTKLHKVEKLTDSADALARATATLRVSGITALNAAIEETAKYLDGAKGRRVIVLLSDGQDTVRPEAFAEALARAQRSDVMIYAISPAGADGETSPMGRVGAATLRRFAEATGGTAFFPPVRTSPRDEAADLDAIYGRIVDELAAHYVLTYYSEAPHTQGMHHALHVEVKRPGLTVTSRTGFYLGAP